MVKRLTILAAALLAGCAPKGYHTVCDKEEWVLMPQWLDGKTFILVPQLMCTKDHFEKDAPHAAG